MAHEIRAWIDLTTGNYHGVVAAARVGIETAPVHSVTIQLAAQEAKAWARIGDRRATECRTSVTGGQFQRVFTHAPRP